jgi:hypothetical protein
VPKFRVTYGPFEIDAENEDDAIAKAAEAMEDGRLSELGSRAAVTVERVADPGRPGGFVAEGVRRQPRDKEN